MIKLFSKKITEFLINQNVIQDEAEIYQYGFEQIISSVMGFIGILLISLYLDILLEGVIYSLSFYIIRKYTGGFHCKTYLTCNLSFICIFVIYHYINLITSSIFSIIVLLISFYFIWVLAPCDHDKKKFTGMERNLYKRISRGIIVIITLISIVLYSFTQTIGLANFIANAIGIISILLVIGKAERRKETHEIL